MAGISGIALDILYRMEQERRANLFPNTSTKVREKRATLKFSTEELLHDIANMAYVEGDLIDGGNEHAAHQVRDICEDGNRERVLRVVDMAIAKCRERLYPYTREDAQDGTELDNAPNEKEEHIISMLLPEDFSKTTLDYLNKLLHEYICCAALADWMTIANTENKASAAAWAAKAEDAQEQVTKIINLRRCRVRRTISPI